MHRTPGQQPLAACKLGTLARLFVVLGVVVATIGNQVSSLVGVRWELAAHRLSQPMSGPGGTTDCESSSSEEEIPAEENEIESSPAIARRSHLRADRLQHRHDLWHVVDGRRISTSSLVRLPHSCRSLLSGGVFAPMRC